MSNTIHKKFSLERVILGSLLLLNLLLLMYWSILAYYSRLHYDDLHFLWEMREMSVFEYVKDMYFSRSGRFVAYAVNGVVSEIIDFFGFHQLWAGVYYFLGIGICWLVVKDMNMPVSRFGLFMGVCFFYNLYILTNIDFPVFFWLCAMSYYLMFPLACLLLKYLNEEKLNRWQWLILMVLIVLIGGGHEAFTPIVLFMMLVNGLYYWHLNGWIIKDTWAMPQVRRIIVASFVIMALFAIVVAAPGNYVRMNGCEEFVQPIGLLAWIKALANAMGMFLYFMVFYVPYYLVAALLAFYVGGRFNGCLPMAKWKIVLTMIVGFAAYLFFSSIPSAYLYNGFGIQRNYTHVVCAFLLISVSIGFVLGVGHPSKKVGVVSLFGILALIVVMVVNIDRDTPTAKNYSRAVDERIDYLCGLRDRGQTETVVVKPYPIPYTEDVKSFVLTKMGGRDVPRTLLYYIPETESSEAEYEYHLKRVLNLNFDFVLEKGTSN